ncbi:MAG: hypothetical protein ACQERN_02000 [Thermodesulfobacteriota bacterium]
MDSTIYTTASRTNQRDIFPARCIATPVLAGLDGNKKTRFHQTIKRLPAHRTDPTGYFGIHMNIARFSRPGIHAIRTGQSNSSANDPSLMAFYEAINFSAKSKGAHAGRIEKPRIDYRQHPFQAGGEFGNHR